MTSLRQQFRRLTGKPSVFQPEPALEVIYRDLFLRELALLGEEDRFFPTGGAANYSLLYLILRLGSEFRPASVLDIGAGQSTLLWAMLQRRGFVGDLLTLENDPDWAARIGAQVTHEIMVSPLQPMRNCTGYFGNGCSQLIPKWAHGLRATYSTADSFLNASFNWRYVGALTNANNASDPAISGANAANPTPAQTTFYRLAPVSYFDLALTFNIAKRFAFRVIANNLLDKNPPIIPNSYNVSLARNNTIPQRYDSLGRQIAIGTTIQF